MRVLVIFLLLTQALLAYPHPVCSQCHKRHRSKRCTKKPADRSLVCGQCGDLLRGKTYRFQDSGLGFCADCYENTAKCDYCRQPTDLQQGGRRLSDGRLLCKSDEAKARAAEKRARDILPLTKKELEITFPGVFALSPAVKSLHLVPRDVLAKEMGYSKTSDAASLGGFARIEQIIFGEEVENRPAVIFILNGQPLESILSSSSHEYAHVWQSQKNPNFARCSREIKEGFAEWVSYKVNLKNRRPKHAEAKLTGNRGPYTTGFKKFLKLERKVGTSKIFEFAATATSF